jgi:hypothetical protein
VKKLILPLLVAGHVVSGGLAQAATYYVSKAGNDNNSCAQAQSASTPKLTVAAGLGCMAGADTLLVRAGTYNERIANNVPSGSSWTNKTRVAAYPGETVWLQPSSGYWAIYFGGDVGAPVVNPQYIEFDGINVDARRMLGSAILYDNRNGSVPNHIRFKNAEINADRPAGTAPDGNSGSISSQGSDNEFLSLSIHGTNGGYGVYLAGNRDVLDGCDIFNVASLGVHIYRNGGNPTGNVVRNNRIHDITESWFFSQIDSRIGGILLAGTNNVAYNNVIYHVRLSNGLTPTPGALIVFYSSGDGRAALNNTLYNFDGNAFNVDAGATNTKIQNNIAWGGTNNTIADNGSATLKDHNRFSDPLAVNAAGGDFHLQAGSPAIDAGTTETLFSSDKDLVARPKGAAWDIGAYEFPGATLSPPTGLRIIQD